MIDSHSHLYLLRNKQNNYLKNALQHNIKNIICVGIDYETSKQSLKLAEKYKEIFATAGVHPSEVGKKDDLSKIENLLSHKKVVAYGEIGLDYYWTKDNISEQQRLFINQIILAKKYKLPIIIHNRNADNDVIEILKDFPDVPRVFHCFSSGPEMVERAFEISEHTFFSFTGTITYSKKGKTIRSIKEIPIERIMIETDCPYLTPKAYKGQENEPSFCIEIAKKIAEIKQINLEEVDIITTETTKSFFNIQS